MGWATDIGRRRNLVRIVVIVASAALIALAIQVSIVPMATRGNPALALAWRPSDARALTRIAEENLKPDATDAERSQIRRWAEAALKRDPTIAAAARILGLLADIDGDREKASRLLHYADFLSRRDLGTQLWLIDEAVSRDDIEQALHHYDVALRTTRLSPPILFPILLAATEDRPVIEPLAEVLAREPEWATPFLSMLVEAGPSTPNVILLLDTIAALGAPANPDIIDQFVRRLAREGNYQTAWRIYTAARPADARSAVRNGGFERTGANVPFDWALASDASLNAEPFAHGAGREGSALFVHADNGRGGEVARQLLMLPAGEYRLTTVVGEIDPAEAPWPSWSIMCVEPSGATIASMPLAGDESDTREQAETFSVPRAGCPAQWLVLMLPAVDQRGGVSGWIDSVTIRPAG